MALIIGTFGAQEKKHRLRPFPASPLYNWSIYIYIYAPRGTPAEQTMNKLWVWESCRPRVWWKLWVNNNWLLNEPLNRRSRCFNGSTLWPAGILASMKPKRLDQHYYSTFTHLCRSDLGTLERVHVWRSKDGSKMWPQFSATARLQYRGHSSLLWQMFFSLARSPSIYRKHFDPQANYCYCSMREREPILAILLKILRDHPLISMTLSQKKKAAILWAFLKRNDRYFETF